MIIYTIDNLSLFCICRRLDIQIYFIYKCLQVKHLLETNMEKGMLNYNETGYDGVTHTWDIIQTEVGG